jgi:hypothetical protein
MKQLIEDLISALEYHVEQTRPIYSTTVALQAAREALKSLPPQRTWVGLTDEDLFSIYNQTHWNVNEDWNYERAIEAKLKEKNT